MTSKANICYSIHTIIKELIHNIESHDIILYKFPYNVCIKFSMNYTSNMQIKIWSLSWSRNNVFQSNIWIVDSTRLPENVQLFNAFLNEIVDQFILDMESIIDNAIDNLALLNLDVSCLHTMIDKVIVNKVMIT